MGAGPGVTLLGYYNILPSRVTLSESNFPESVSRKIMTLLGGHFSLSPCLSIEARVLIPVGSSQSKQGSES